MTGRRMIHLLAFAFSFVGLASLVIATSLELYAFTTEQHHDNP
jgi:hypothetical protein